MHRKHPTQRVWAKGKRASTIIRPHSIYEMKRSKKAAQRATGAKADGDRGAYLDAARSCAPNSMTG